MLKEIKNIIHAKEIKELEEENMKLKEELDATKEKCKDITAMHDSNIIEYNKLKAAYTELYDRYMYEIGEYNNLLKEANSFSRNFTSKMFHKSEVNSF